MPPVDSVPEFETRRSFYKIDSRVLSILAAAWPIIAPTIDQSIKEVIDGVLELPIGKRVGVPVAVVLSRPNQAIV